LKTMTKGKKMFKRGSERGIALLVAVFALLLLSVIGLGMMYSTNMETSINSNYRDKQAATYAAMAGLQEARDRMRPYDPTLATPDGRIPAPTGLPTLGSPNIIYIINPKTGEDIQPWDPSNKYMDTELCHENVLGLSGTAGVPCGPSDLPLVSTWYTVYDDSDSASSNDVWKQANPLDFKWVRIQLKTNNNTPVAANGVTGDSHQVCWEGERQLLLPDGYGPNCMRYGSVIQVPVTNPGSGYTATPPTVTIAPPTVTGIQATATANMEAVDAVVDAVNPVSFGSGYLSPPTVTIDPPASGTQASAHVCVSALECGTDAYIPPGASVASVSITDAGTVCYPNLLPAVPVLFSGGGGTGAVATAALASGPTSCIAGWSVTGVCSAHRNDTLTGVQFTGGGGSGFTGTLRFDSSGTIVTGYPTIQNSGTGYASSPTGLTGFTGCGSLTFTAQLGRRIASPQTITLTTGGGGYTSVPTISFAPGSGMADTLASGTATLGPEPAGARQVRKIIVDNGGSGYDTLSPPNVTISGGGGSGANFTAHVAGSSYRVHDISIDNHGYGYIAEPAVTISGGAGSGATARAVLGGGANWGKIYLLTALAQTKSGARTMLQAEVTTAITGFHTVGALTIDGPNPTMQHMPNSMNFNVNGNDANSCGGTPDITQPAIGGYDDPNADPATHSVNEIVDALPDDRLDHIIGEGSWPSVRNVYESLGETLGTTNGLLGLLKDIQSKQTNTGSTIDYGTPSAWAYNYIDGDATLNGGTNGYGVLAVTGKLTMNGNFTWHGTILIIGDGIMDFGGGGGGTIVGTVFVAKIFPDPTHHADSDRLASLGSPTVNWNGGGGNSILYDHCWVDNVMSHVPNTSWLYLNPLKLLSFRNLPY
jgi:hypothetical protein